MRFTAARALHKWLPNTTDRRMRRTDVYFEPMRDAQLTYLLHWP